MGKTPKPLVILAHSSIAAWEEVHALAAQGHAVVIGPSVLVGDPEARIMEPDLILHPNAWRMNPAHRKYLTLAVVAARKQRWPKEKD